MKYLYLFSLSTFIILFASLNNVKSQVEVDSVDMGAFYANDIYYSFANSTVHTVDRTNWDIGFYTVTWSAGVIINDGNGVELFTYPHADTSGWSTVDTTGLSSWPVMYNSTEDWEEGAFNRFETGHPDYGWGVYNTVNHDVVGDSIFLLKKGNDYCKKVWIVKKISTENTFVFKFANLDGSDEVEVTLNCSDYEDKNFIYYSLTNEAVIDREPNSDTWDVLFTKYNTMLEEGSPYIVTGALNNVYVSANKYEMVNPDYSEWGVLPMDESRSSVGYDWKDFDFTTGWMVFDSTVFFVTDLNGDVNKLIFTEFEGMSSGKIVFEKSFTSPANIQNPKLNSNFNIYPNPASDFISIKPLNSIDANEISISDITGKVVLNVDSINNSDKIDVSQLPSGLYFVTIGSGSNIAVQKLLIR